VTGRAPRAATSSDGMMAGETSKVAPFKPDGGPTIIPRIFRRDVGGVVGFLKSVFGAAGDVRAGARAEMKIGESMIMVSDGRGAREALPTFLYVYVENADKTYQRALAAGALTIEGADGHAVRRSARHGAGPVGQCLADRDARWRASLMSARAEAAR
jgi:PhnB protein